MPEICSGPSNNPERNMSLAMGLDAGGTYTDAVIYDLTSDTLLASAKAPTTPPTYVEGVAGAVAKLPSELCAKVAYAAISTTLATNAIVEGRSAPAGLILIGHDEHDLQRVGWGPARCVSGRHDIRGNEVEAFDERAFGDALRSLTDEAIEGLAISSMMATRNPEHELRAFEIAGSMNGVDVVMGHQVSDVLNSITRAQTAALNAGLIPLLHRFINAVEEVLRRNDMGSTPCMMVTGDGSLVSTTVARQRPVETILSGPACSAIGAGRLARVPDALVVDIGGTTTDIAVLEDGAPRMADRGVRVGGWRAGVASAQVLTRGLGGDSVIEVHPAFAVGPRRVIPISRAAENSDSVIDSLNATLRQLKRWGRVGGDWRLTNPTLTYVRLPGEPPTATTGRESAILNALAAGPRTLVDLAKELGQDYLSLFSTGRLETWGLVHRAGLTPTDLWHLTGDFARWDTDAARIAAELTALRLGMDVRTLIDAVEEQATRKLTRQSLQGFLGLDGEADGDKEATVAGQLMAATLEEQRIPGLRPSLSLDAAVVGVGAPAKLFLEGPAQRLGARLVIPDGAEVANAVGAATGVVIVALEALVRPEGDGGVVCYAPESRRGFESRRDATRFAQEELVPLVVKELSRRGAAAAEIELTVEHRGVQVRDVPEPVWWESAVVARGTGRPAGRGEGEHFSEPPVNVAVRWAPPELEQVDSAAAG